MNYSMVGGDTGIIQLTTITTNKIANVSYGCNESEFSNAMKSFYGSKLYTSSVVRTIYDSNGNTLNATTGASRIDYLVSNFWSSSSTLSSERLSLRYFNYTGVLYSTSVQDHSPLINGTFTLRIGGVSIQYSNTPNIPYNIDASTLQTALRLSPIVGFDYVEVTQTKVNNDCGYSCTWIIQYKRFNSAIPSITLEALSLSGGTSGGKISSKTRRYYSSSIIFDPVDYRFLNTLSNTINVQVTTNGVPSICNGSCSYTFETNSEITALSYTGSTLSLALNDTKSLNFGINNITISVRGQPCNIIPGSTISAISCYMQNNTDNTPILVAGPLMPLVYVKPYGIANLASGVTSPNVNLVATSLLITSAGNNGGVLVSLTGKGFPVDKSDMTISICSNLATIKTISNIKVDFYLPSCSTTGNKTVTITVGSITNTDLSFNYTDGTTTAPSILFISPTSANPGVKGTLEIYGQKFGTNSSAVQVFLANSTGKVYTLTVLSLNDTYLKVGLPGGEAGDFIVQVNLKTTGDSIIVNGSNQFSYVFSVASISP
jgi:hypothetical protein